MLKKITIPRIIIAMALVAYISLAGTVMHAKEENEQKVAETIDQKDKQILELKIAALSERIEKLQAQYVIAQQELNSAKSEYQALLKKEQDLKKSDEVKDGTMGGKK